MCINFVFVSFHSQYDIISDDKCNVLFAIVEIGMSFMKWNPTIKENTTYDKADEGNIVTVRFHKINPFTMIPVTAITWLLLRLNNESVERIHSLIMHVIFWCDTEKLNTRNERYCICKIPFVFSFFLHITRTGYFLILSEVNERVFILSIEIMLRQSWIKYAHFNLAKMRATMSFYMHERDKWLLSISISIAVIVGLPNRFNARTYVSYTCWFLSYLFVHNTKYTKNVIDWERNTVRQNRAMKETWSKIRRKKKQIHNESTIVCISWISI